MAPPPAGASVDGPAPGQAPRTGSGGRLHGKTALITGGGTGLGRAISLVFGREGARVVVAGRRSEPLQAVVREIRAAGGTATFTRGDVTKPDRVELMVKGAIYNFGGLDILVNNAGAFLPGSILDLDEKKWDRVLTTNLKGAYLVSRLVIPALKASGGGVIINIASAQAETGMRLGAAYCASKGGLIHLTRAMALDHAAEGIRVHAILPGLLDSPMLAPGAPGRDALARAAADGPRQTMEEIAGLALDLACAKEAGDDAR